MTIQLSTLLDELRQDHRNMAVLLDLLEREVGHIHDGEAADEELMQDIMRYLTCYSDAVHHPKEDILYASMQRIEPGLARNLERVEPEHQRLAERGDALRRDIEASTAGTPIARKQLCDEARDYLRTLRRHMAWEEEDLFRRAAQLLQSHNEITIDVSKVDESDPVFGEVRQHSFSNLLEHITVFSTPP